MAMARYPGFSANLAMLFRDAAFLDRFARARRAGFGAVEISTPELYGHRPSEVQGVLDGEGLRCVLLNLPAGDWARGDRGLAAQAGRGEEFLRSLQIGAEYAERWAFGRFELRRRGWAARKCTAWRALGAAESSTCATWRGRERSWHLWRCSLSPSTNAACASHASVELPSAEAGLSPSLPAASH